MKDTEFLSQPTTEQDPSNYKTPKLRELESICPGIERVDEVANLFRDPTTGRVRVLDNDSHEIIGHSIFLGGELDWMLVVERNQKLLEQTNPTLKTKVYNFIGKIAD
jgi:hypothetical protein